jgi:hypothetical protein
MKVKKRYSYMDTQGNRPNVESCDMCDASIVDIGNRRLSVPTCDSPNHDKRMFDPKFGIAILCQECYDNEVSYENKKPSDNIDLYYHNIGRFVLPNV